MPRICSFPLMFALLMSIMFSVAIGAADNTADVFCKEGKKAFTKKDYAKAEDMYAKALNEDPKSLDAQYGMAQVCEKLGRADEEAEYLSNLKEALAEIEKKTPDQKRMFTNAGKRLKKLADGSTEVDAIVGKYIDKLIGLATKAIVQNQFANAESALSIALRLEPEHAKANDLMNGLQTRMYQAGRPMLQSNSMDGWSPFAAAWGFKVKNGVMTTSAPHGSGAVYNEKTPEAFRWSCNVTLIEPDPEKHNAFSANWMLGIGMDDQKKHYSLMLEHDRIWLGYFDEGATTLVSEAKLFLPIELGQGHDIIIEVKDGSLRVTCDTQKILDTKLKLAFAYPYVGVGVYSGTVSFGNMTIQEIK